VVVPSTRRPNIPRTGRFGYSFLGSVKSLTPDVYDRYEKFCRLKWTAKMTYENVHCQIATYKRSLLILVRRLSSRQRDTNSVIGTFDHLDLLYFVLANCM
jgi:hypothetical protein